MTPVDDMESFRKRRKLPPLSAARTFEAVARTMSITGAARDLNVTPSAVSQQLRLLEEYLGVSLVDRGPRSFALTQHGQQLFPSFSHGLDLIARACETLKGKETTLALSTLPSFATRWLNPRLGSFGVGQNNFHLYISTSVHLIDFSKETFDVAIRYGDGRYPDLVCDFLFPEYFLPVCAPALADHYRNLLTTQNTADITFICDVGMDTGERVTWARWFAHHKSGFTAPTRRLLYSDAAMSIDAAVSGYGLLLGRRVLVDDLIAEGKLTPLTSDPVDFGLGYYLVFPSISGLSPAARAFRNWLLAVAEEERMRLSKQGEGIGAVVDTSQR